MRLKNRTGLFYFLDAYTEGGGLKFRRPQLRFGCKYYLVYCDCESIHHIKKDAIASFFIFPFTVKGKAETTAFEI